MVNQLKHQDHVGEIVESTATLYCEVHPRRETSLRCNKCGRPMCTECAVRTPVGYRCRECVRGHHDLFFNATSLDYVIASAVSAVLGGIGALIVSAIGSFFLAFFLAPAAGALIGNVVHQAIGRRRGRYTWVVVSVSIIAGSLLLRLVPALIFLGLVAAAGGADQPVVAPVLLRAFRFNFGLLIYLIMAPGAAAGQLRLGRRR